MADKTIPVLKVLRGNVGIGSTTPTSNLEVIASGADLENMLRVTSGTAGRGVYIGAPQSATVAGVIDFRNGNVATRYLDFRGEGTSRMVIQTDGNVGIGTTAPSQKLYVHGNIVVNAQILTPGGSNLTLAPNTGLVSVAGSLQASGAGLSSFAGPLTVSGTLTIANNIQILGAADGVAYSFTGDTDTGVQSGGTNTLQLTTGGTKALDFDGNQLATFTGHVLIGNTLKIYSDDTSTDPGVPYMRSNGGYLVIEADPNNDIYMQNDGSGDLRLVGGGGDVILPAAASRVGIGTTGPTQKLHVFGNFLFGSSSKIGFNNDINSFVIDGVELTVLR